MPSMKYGERVCVGGGKGGVGAVAVVVPDVMGGSGWGISRAY
jgi:hypothetical protein